jgi:hypothetical protein
MASTLQQTVSALANRIVGVNGANVYTEAGFGNYLVSLFAMLNRGGYTNVRDTLMQILSDSEKKMQNGCDLFVMAFQTRDIRGGKGERELFYHMFLALCEAYPEHVKRMVHLIPEYGCWRDMLTLWTLSSSEQIRSVIDEVVCSQFRKDMVACSEDGGKLSLLAKWMPREDSAYDHLSIHYAILLFPDISELDNKRRAYRKACSAMNSRLNTVETKMCGKQWSTIVPEHVPGRCIAKHKRAMLNLVPTYHYVKGHVFEHGGKKHFVKGKLSKLRGEEANAIRYPADVDRMTCRETFVKFTGDVAKGTKTVKGADVIMPHELVHEIRSNKSMSDEERAVIEGQWVAIRNKLRESGGLHGILPLADFSGSMEGIPMEVSMALGILISEIVSGPFANQVISFDSQPAWISFADASSLTEKVQIASEAPWGCSTNFHLACNLILERLVEQSVPPEDAPRDLLVLTDMGFDSAIGGNSGGVWKTQIETIRTAFTTAGYTPPRIIIWNLRAAYKEFHAKATDEGVITLSGWSPAILQVLQDGNLEVKTSVDGVRAILDHERYDSVRLAWIECIQGA